MPMDYRQAAKLIRKHGGKFVRHGASHDIFETADGQEISLPRHKDEDISKGVERDIKKKLGLL